MEKLKKLFNFEIRNKKKLGYYLLFSLVMLFTLFAFASTMDLIVNKITNALLHTFTNSFLLTIIAIGLGVLLLMQMGRTDEFSVEETGINEYKERGIMALVSRATLICILLLFTICICF